MLRARAFVVVLVAVLVAAPFASLTVTAAAPLAVSSATSEGAPLGAPELLGLALAIGMAIKVKDAGTVAAKWRSRASAAAGDYKTGVQSAGADWEAGAAAGAENYAAGVNQAIADGRFARGVREAGGSKYAARAAELGASRFAPGVQASEGEMAKGIAPVLQTLSAMTLPPRRPKGDPGNLARVSAVTEALRKLKTGR